jgi:hypothetical protein
LPFYSTCPKNVISTEAVHSLIVSSFGREPRVSPFVFCLLSLVFGLWSFGLLVFAVASRYAKVSALALSSPQQRRASEMLKKSALLKGTASAVPQVFVRRAALAAEVLFLFREAFFQHPLQPLEFAFLSR